ncbi:hypothetical protein WQ53_02920 [Pseudoxanthomonas suwonensis]|uniref:Uncharacterized protein n=1 Tax=Pseudoxanthomonas suwonensis TaxID=314722 RepID=A0A0E3UMA5_9GAMM|nr:hypothetical protein WQ53_02920 [Pseudoxanthomonas suwonensis]
MSFFVVAVRIRTMCLDLLSRVTSARRKVSFVDVSRTADVFSWLLIKLNSMFLFSLHIFNVL